MDKQTTKILAKEVIDLNKKLDEITNQIYLVDKYEDIISEVLEDYNYKGRYFKVEYLPILLALALEKLDKRKSSLSVSEVKTLNDSLHDFYHRVIHFQNANK
jgi:hypothetical protein